MPATKDQVKGPLARRLTVPPWPENHPHVLQPAEHYRTRRDPDRVVPVFYSLGNLTNPFSAPYLCRSGVARIELAKGLTAGGAVCAYVRSATLSEVVQVADPACQKLSLRLA